MEKKPKLRSSFQTADQKQIRQIVTQKVQKLVTEKAKYTR